MTTRSGRKFARKKELRVSDQDVFVWSDDENPSQNDEFKLRADVPKFEPRRSPRLSGMTSDVQNKASKGKKNSRIASKMSSTPAKRPRSQSRDKPVETPSVSDVEAVKFDTTPKGGHESATTPLSSRKFFKSSENRNRTGLIQKCDSRHGFMMHFGKCEEMYQPISNKKHNAHDENTPKRILKKKAILKRTPVRSASPSIDSGLGHDLSQEMVDPINVSEHDEPMEDAQSIVNDVSEMSIHSAKNRSLTDSTPENQTSKKVKFYPLFEKHARDTSITRSTDPKKLMRRRLPFLKADNQYAIDMGQKDFDAFRCNICKMLYTPGEITDEKHHAQYHDLFINSVKFGGWKQERVLRYLDDGSRIIAVRPTDPKYMLKKMDDLFSVADLDLNINVNLTASIKDSSLYLIYVTLNNRIAGFVAAEAISEASKVLDPEGYTVSTDTLPANVGVTRIWVHPSFRKQNVATNLLDTLRANFLKDEIIPRSKLAFSDTTDAGRVFVQKYTGTKNFLVFQYQPNICFLK